MKRSAVCACGDIYPANSYGAGFMDGNNGVCENCDMADEHPLDRLAQAGLVRAAAKWERGDMEARSKYHREIKPGVWVDVYSVLVAYGVTNPADAHAIKKMLMPGGRGAKDSIQDREEAIASLKRAIEIEREGF